MNRGVTQGMKIIFLDFDNVLNTESWIKNTRSTFRGVVPFSLEFGQAMIDPSLVARVQRICDITGASVMLVTGWRRFCPVDKLKTILETRGLKAPVLGAVGGVKFSGDLRASATREWLQQHPEVTQYVILDDDPLFWIYKIWKDHWVPIEDGLEDAHVDEAVRILNRE